VKARPLRGLALTELGFGGAALGNLYRGTSDADARLAVDAAWDGGVRYYDTAERGTSLRDAIEHLAKKHSGCAGSLPRAKEPEA
jgi:O-acetyl-ADP-ribose deacetylase (regulator of RNase III)